MDYNMHDCKREDWLLQPLTRKLLGLSVKDSVADSILTPSGEYCKLLILSLPVRVMPTQL